MQLPMRVGDYFNDDCPSAVNPDGNHEQYNAQDGGMTKPKMCFNCIFPKHFVSRGG